MKEKIKELQDLLEQTKMELKLLLKMAKEQRIPKELADIQIDVYLDTINNLKKKIENLKK